MSVRIIQSASVQISESRCRRGDKKRLGRSQGSQKRNRLDRKK